jgi:hypothetical protein
MAERVINIIGLGKSAKNVPDTGENWGINYAYKFKHRLDKLFYFDNLFDGGDKQIEPTNYNVNEYLSENPTVEIIGKVESQIKTINQDNNEVKLLANVKQFPLNDALDLAPGMYFTSTIAYIIAYAILQKVDRIRLYGFEIWSGSDSNEYTVQKACVNFWLAFAMGRGIKVEIPWYLLLTADNAQNLYGYSMPHAKL